jgi:hypothetical protein
MALAALLPCAAAKAETPADIAMAQEIGRQLKESGQLSGYSIGIKFEDGVAWLNGSVTSPAQREVAVQLARRVRGVQHVVCRLDVSQQGSAQRSNVSAAFNQDDTYGAGAQRPAPPMQRTANAGRTRLPSNNMAVPANNMPVPAARMPAQRGVVPVSGQAVLPANTYADGGGMGGGMGMAPMPTAYAPGGSGHAVNYDNAQLPGYAWPSYASYPNYAALTYPQQYSPTAWPYIGPFYPYPQVPLAWRKVSLEWDDGWWFLDFSAHNSSH